MITISQKSTRKITSRYLDILDYTWYIKTMKKHLFIILLACLLAGCETSQSDHDRVSSEIDRLRAQAESSSIGDNIKIVVNMLSTDAAESFTIDSLFQYVDKNISITKNPQLMTGSGLTIGVADSNFRAQLNIAKTQLTFSEETQLFLLLADGTSGYINIGTEIAVPQFYYSNQWYSSTVYDFRQAGRSLKVTARKLSSGLIYIELTPVFSRFLSGGGDLELTEFSTTVTVSPSQTLVIGGGDTSTENVATALLAFRQSGRQRRTLITVTPYTQ